MYLHAHLFWVPRRDGWAVACDEHGWVSTPGKYVTRTQAEALMREHESEHA